HRLRLRPWCVRSWRTTGKRRTCAVSSNSGDSIRSPTCINQLPTVDLPGLLQFGKNLLIQDFFQVEQGSGNGRTVDDAVVVNDPDVHLAVGPNNPIVEGRRQGRQGMERLGPQCGVDADAECAQPSCSPVPGRVIRKPPGQPAQRPGKTTDLK